MSPRKTKPVPVAGETGFDDFEIGAFRENASAVRVAVQSSAGGPTLAPVRVPFTEDAAAELHSNSIAGPKPVDVAARIGRALAGVLLPRDVYALLHASTVAAKARAARGLRVRLSLDSSLSDLPWEFLYRPELPDVAAASGFLVLDPFFSIVRGAARQSAPFPVVHGPQRLLFLGATHQQYGDIFHVEEEFRALKANTGALGKLLVPYFADAADQRAIGDVLSAETPLFHYTGNAFVAEGRGYCVAHAQSIEDSIPSVALGRRLADAKTRVAVFTATESHSAAFVNPILDAGVPVVVAFNGPDLTNKTAIDFSGAFYRALAAGLSIDEAVGYGRGVLAAASLKEGQADWGFFVLHSATADAIPFPRIPSEIPRKTVESTRVAHERTASDVAHIVEELDGDDYGALLSELADRGVLILGRFTDRRRKVLETIRQRLREHPRRYKPILFTFDRPQSRDLVESIRWFAGASRFVIADLTEPKSVPAELQAIVPDYPSVPIVAIASAQTREYPLFEHIKRYRTVIESIVRYRGEVDLLERLDREVIEPAEARLKAVLPRDAGSQ